MIWVNSTPIIDEMHNARKEGFSRFNKDVVKYNEMAEEIIKQNDKNKGIKILFEHRSDFITDKELDMCYNWVDTYFRGEV